MSNYFDAVIVGGGITGLSCAWYLKRAGLNVSLLEQDDSIGGRIRTTYAEHCVIEEGPHTLQVKDADLWELVQQVGLGSEIEFAAPGAQHRYIVRNGRICAVPTTLASAFTSPILSLTGKSRLLWEVMVPKGIGEGEDIDTFVQRRFGKEAADYLANPFIRGVFAGDAKKLILSSSFPKLSALERDHGSVLKALCMGRGNGARPKTPSPLYSFRVGLARLPQKIGEELSSNVFTGSKVASLKREPSGEMELQCIRQHEVWPVRARQVVLTLSARQCARFLEPFSQGTAHALSKIYYPPLATVFLTFPRDLLPGDRVTRVLDAFGILCPSVENRFTLGILFSSTLFPERVPSSMVAVTAMVGGSESPERAELSDSELQRQVRNELSDLVGISAAPAFCHVRRWKESIPQYTSEQVVAHRELCEFEKNFPFLHIAGNFREGVSVGACVRYAKRTAERVLQYHHSAGRREYRLSA